MNQPGDGDLRVRTRRALLDALEALSDQLEALVVIGAQAIYLHTGEIEVALPEETKDADIGVDVERLQEDPRIEAAIEAAGFYKDLENPQPGTWLSPDGIPVDLMVPEALAGPPARRGARVPPHDKGATRRATGLEGVVIDNQKWEIGALEPGDERVFTVRVAGPAALLVAKLHKIGERNERSGKRLRDKDAHDIYRLLVAVDREELAGRMSLLRSEELSATVVEQALDYLAELFAEASSVGSRMVGRAEVGVGEPEIVAASVSVLANDLLATAGAERNR